MQEPPGGIRGPKWLTMLTIEYADADDAARYLRRTDHLLVVE